MKKNVLFVMLALCMMFGLMFIAVPDASAAEMDVHSHCYCAYADKGAVPETHVCAENVTWEVLSASTTVADGGHYYLTANTAKGITISGDIEVTICLNGFNLYAGATIVISNGTLNICNCQDAGRIYSTNRTRGTVVLISSSSAAFGTVNLYSGNISGAANNSAYCRGVEVKGGVFNMYGGQVVNGRSNGDSINDSKQGYGGNICIYNNAGKVAKFNMYGGSVTGGQATNLGGNIYVEGAKFTMTGGTVTGGKTTGTPAAATDLIGWGGNIFVTSTSGAIGSVTLNGGTVTTGNATNGGNIATDGNNGKRVDLTIAGAVVSDGTASADGGNIYVHNTTNGTLFNMKSGVISGGTATVNGGNICTNGTNPVTLSGGFITGGSANKGGSIYADNGSGTVTLSGTAVSGGTATDAGGNVYVLAGTLTLSGSSVMGGNAKNGGNISSQKVVNLSGGTVSGGTATTSGGNIYLNGTGAKLLMTDGTISGGNAGSTGGNIYSLNSPEVSVTGGQVSDGTAQSHGGNMYITHETMVESRKLTISNATISGGVSGGNGGSLYVAKTGVVTISNATVQNGAAANNGNNAHLTGNGTCQITSSSFTVGEGIKAGSNGGNVCFADGTVTVTSTQFTGGDATRGGAVAVGVTTVATLDDCTIETAYGSTGKCIYISAGGNLTLKDSTVKNLTDSGTAVWCCGTLNLQGTVDIPEGNMDMMLDARNESGAVIDISGLTQVDEAITIRRYELDSEDDDCGLLATGVAADQVGVFQTWKNKYRLTYNADESTLYLTLPAVHAKTGKEILRGYDSLNEALAETEDLGTTWYVVNTAMDGQTIDKSIMLDLNGQILTNVTVNAGVQLQLIDKANDDYDAAACGSFSGTVNGQIASVAHTDGTYGSSVKHYVVLKDADGVYTAHRFVAAITHMSLKPATVALGFKATFRADEVARAAVVSYGYEMWVNDGTAKTAAKVGSFEDRQVVTLRLQNILSDNAESSKFGATATIYGNAFIKFKVDAEGTEAYANGHAAPMSTSMKTMIEAVNGAVEANPATYTKVQMTAVQKLVNTYSTYMTDWATSSITAWTPSEDTTE